MKETLLVKHAVGGRTFIHTDKHPLEYKVKPEAGGWTFVIRTPRNEAVEEILKWKNELNVFLFEEYPDKPTIKKWYYVKDGEVEFDEASESLIIRANSRIEYVPDEFSIQ
ncbi:hypothetical protein SAMN02799630_00894 [Paenibacillus sp. UNCCL117]|uniref:hypothetical protein n=1 Tax=unclassified Paenibacillus TaxID=185978 RepID=UPI00088CAE6E|nr:MULTISPECIES: hypothetical protein [unclassified Paenibacillus]SDC24426.1 hypothetical protein SAMN04488602_101695 [Paenibacillus sp. cl123]SFW19558.1 hypothetical protein SAMN02799630_00894 [Paenibacillus sp. UNCCL117]